MLGVPSDNPNCYFANYTEATEPWVHNYYNPYGHHDGYYAKEDWNGDSENVYEGDFEG